MTAVDDTEYGGMFLSGLADVTGQTPRRCRAMVAALVERGLVTAERMHAGDREDGMPVSELVVRVPRPPRPPQPLSPQLAAYLDAL